LAQDPDKDLRMRSGAMKKLKPKPKLKPKLKPKKLKPKPTLKLKRKPKPRLKLKPKKLKPKKLKPKKLKPKAKLKSKKLKLKLNLHDTFTRDKRPFKPLDTAHVRMYVCGPTVYDFAHIGNARPVIVFDVLFRLLRHLYGADHVTYVRNITDVDDKINARAGEEYPDLPLNEAIRLVTEKTEKQFHKDVDALGCLRPTIEPRATEHIKQMKTLIGRLIENGRAYVLDDHVLFRVKGLRSYGKLSHRSLKDMRTSERGEVAPKHDPMDFVLWKPSKPGEPSWPSPGRIKTRGRPGWHIECSAMSWKYLGERFDIHGGGIDLLFPHHENELAQSCRAFHIRKMARVWMHNGFLQVEGEKMSKSLGNFVTIHELLDTLPGDVIRLQMLMTHYRQPLDWTSTRTELAQHELEDWGHVLQGRYAMRNDKKPDAVIEALSDDLNTPDAVRALRELFTKAQRGGLEEELTFAANCRFLGFRELGRPGLFQLGVSGINVEGRALFAHSDTVVRLRAAIANDMPESVQADLIALVKKDGLDVDIAKNGTVTLVQGDKVALEQKVEGLITARSAARARKDWQEADHIREELKAMGIELEDHKGGTTTWKVSR
jgi:cysteinyl-tRNA synthetase